MTLAAPETQAAGRLAAVRRDFPVLERVAYLNSGSAGPLARSVVEEITRQAGDELLAGRASLAQTMGLHFELRSDLRDRFARLLGAHADEIALTQHTTDGINIAIWGARWNAGDVVVLTSHEHEGGLLPAYAAARRFGLTVRVVDIGRGDGDVAAAIARAMCARTRMVVASHVSYKTGAILPIAEIAEEVHRRGAFLVVDGAQAAGMIAVDVSALGADAYAISGQKWLCGPEGAGALFVRRDRVSELSPTAVGHFALRDFRAIDLSGYFMPAAGALRYEGGTLFWPLLYGMRTALRYLEEDVGYAWIFARNLQATADTREVVESLPGSRLVSPSGSIGLTAFSLQGVRPHTLVEPLLELGVILRSVEHPTALRISTGFFNDQTDLQRLRDALSQVTNGGSRAVET